MNGELITVFFSSSFSSPLHKRNKKQEICGLVSGLAVEAKGHKFIFLFLIFFLFFLFFLKFTF